MNCKTVKTPFYWVKSYSSSYLFDILLLMVRLHQRTERALVFAVVHGGSPVLANTDECVLHTEKNVWELSCSGRRFFDCSQKLRKIWSTRANANQPNTTEHDRMVLTHFAFTAFFLLFFLVVRRCSPWCNRGFRNGEKYSFVYVRVWSR